MFTLTVYNFTANHSFTVKCFSAWEASAMEDHYTRKGYYVEVH